MVESADDEADERARVSALLAEILYCREEAGRLGLELVRYFLDMAAADVGAPTSGASQPDVASGSLAAASPRDG